MGSRPSISARISAGAGPPHPTTTVDSTIVTSSAWAALASTRTWEVDQGRRPSPSQ